MRKLPPITDDDWGAVSDFNRSLCADFLENSAELSPHSIKVYSSNLRIWFVWVKDNLNNKRHIDITSLDYKRFQNWLINRGCSSADISNKRSAISTLNNYIEVYYQREYPTFRNFINKSIKRPAKSFVHEKEPLTKDELDNLIKELERREEWQKLAYLKFTFETGCRRAESRQLTKDAIELEPIITHRTITAKDGSSNDVDVTTVKYKTKPIRCKGAGATGKVRQLVFGQEAMNALKKWVEVRGGLDADDCPYMFVVKREGKWEQIGESGFNKWCETTFSEIVGRRFHPHLLRESRATQAVVEDGLDIHSVQKLLGHASSETTEIYVIRHDDDDVDDLF